MLTTTAGAAITIPIWVHPHFFASLFSIDPLVVDGVVASLPGLLCALLADFVNMTLNATIQGVGRQRTGCLVNLGIYWGVALPLAGVMTLRWGYGAPAMWIAMAVASSIQVVVLSIIVGCMHWEQETHRSQLLIRSQSNA